MSFITDLNNAQKVETKVHEYIKTQPTLVSKLIKADSSVSMGNFSDWDIYYHFTVEVKNDKYKSENFAFEYYNPKKQCPSGISITKADYVVYATDKYYVFFDTKELLEDLNTHKDIKKSGFCEKKKVGDGNADIYLYKKEYVINNFKSIKHVADKGMIEL